MHRRQIEDVEFVDQQISQGCTCNSLCGPRAENPPGKVQGHNCIAGCWCENGNPQALQAFQVAEDLGVGDRPQDGDQVTTGEIVDGVTDGVGWLDHQFEAEAGAIGPDNTTGIVDLADGKLRTLCDGAAHIIQDANTEGWQCLLGDGQDHRQQQQQHHQR